MKRHLGSWPEIAAAILASPLVFAGGSRGALLYFALVTALAGRGALAELASPLGRLRPKEPS